MASGVKITDEVKAAFSKVSLTSAKTTKLQYAIFKFSDDLKKIVIDQEGVKDDETDYDDFVKKLPPNEVRYVAYDMPFLNKDGTATAAIIFISWVPECCSIKQKMLGASSLNALKQSLNVSKNVIEGDSLSEVDSSVVLEKLGGTAKK